MQKIEEILNFIQSNRLNVSQTEREAGIKRGRMDKWLRGFGMPKVEDSEKLQNWYSKLNSTSEEVQKDAPVSDFKTDYGHDFSARVIADLAASNKAYGLAEQDRAHAAVIREQNNRDMLALLTKQSEAISKEVRQFVNDTVGNFEALSASISALRSVVIAQLPKAEQPKARKTLESHAALILNKGNALQAQSRKEKNIHVDGDR